MYVCENGGQRSLVCVYLGMGGDGDRGGGNVCMHVMCVGLEATGTTGCFPPELTTLVLFTGLSLKGWLAKELRRFFSPALGFQAYTTTPVFLMCVLGVQIQVTETVQQALYWVTSLSLWTFGGYLGATRY